MTPGIAAIFIICFSILLVAGIFKVLEKYPQIGKYIKENVDETDDDEMNNLFDDIANVVNDIENL